MAKSKFVTVTTKDDNVRIGHSAFITIDNPPVNALSEKVRVELSKAFRFLDGRRDIHSIKLQGVGKHFSAGADLQELQKIANLKDSDERRDGAYAFSRSGQQLIRQILSISITTPVTAVLHGAVTGGGLELALACTERVMVDAGAPLIIGLPEATLGVIPGWGGTVLLPLILESKGHNLDVAKDLISWGDLLTSADANTYGISSDKFSKDKTRNLLRQKIVSHHAVALVEEAFDGRELSWDLHDIDRAFEREAQLFARAMMHPDAKEGISAFLEKRKPNFEQ